MRVKSQSALLRSNVDEFEKILSSIDNSMRFENFPVQRNETNENENQQTDELLNFYRTLVNQCQLELGSTDKEKMQED